MEYHIWRTGATLPRDEAAEFQSRIYHHLHEERVYGLVREPGDTVWLQLQRTAVAGWRHKWQGSPLDWGIFR